MGPLDRPAGRGRDVRSRGRGPGRGADQRLPRRPGLHPRRGHRPGRPRHRDPLDGRGAGRGRRRGVRRARHVLVAAGRVQPGPDRPGPGAGRPCRRGHEQRQAHRGARRLAGRAREAGRHRADAARDRGTHQRGERPAGRPPAERRRGRPADGCRRRPDRSHRSGQRAAARRLRLGLARAPATAAGRPGRDDRPGRRGPGGRHRRPVLDRRLPARSAVPTPARRRPLHQGVRDPLGDGRAADRRGRLDRRAARLERPARGVERGRREPAHDDRRPGIDHDPDDAPDRRARSLARRARAAGPAPSRACARSPPGSPSCASRARSSRTSSSRPAGWSGRTA